MKKFQQILLIGIILLSCLPSRVKATHAAGAELIYEWVSDSTYRFYFKFYRDCAQGSSPEPSSLALCFYNTCNAAEQGSALLTKILTLPPGFSGNNGDPVSVGCPGYPTTCTDGNSTLPGYQEWWYSAVVTLPSRCDHWIIYAGVNARNNAITNLSDPGVQTLFVEATLNNKAAQGNSSPYFSVKPVPYVCVNNAYAYNNGAIDVNNDSLSFEMMQPLNGPDACQSPPPINAIPYASSIYNIVNNPISTANTFSIDAATGQLTFTPDIQQIAVMTVLVKEYRNSVLIGSVMRDIQTIVVPCNVPQPILTPAVPSFVDAQLKNGRVEACAGVPFSFCYDIVSPDKGAVLVVQDNHTVSAPGSATSYVGLTTDSLRGCFSWSPSANDTGLRNLTVTVKDSTCQPPGIPISQTFVVPIYIYPPTRASGDTSICAGDSASLSVSGGLIFTWSVLPGGSPASSLSCTQCRTPYASPTKTTTYVVTSDNSTLCKNKDTVTVTLLPQPVFTAGHDTITCVNDSLFLHALLQPFPGITYTINWSPGSSLDNDSSYNPVFKGTKDVSYTVTVTPNGIAACGIIDTLNVTVLPGYTIFTPDTAVCAGDPVQIRGVGDSRYQYSWSPPIGVSDTSVFTPIITPDSSHVYTLVATHPGCHDSLHRIAIEVQPVPIVDAGPTDTTICYGVIDQLNGVVNPPASFYTYRWTPGAVVDFPFVTNPKFQAIKTTLLTLTATTPIGCKSSDSMLINVVNVDFLTVSPDTTLCPGDSALLRVKALSGDSLIGVQWRPPYYISSTDTMTPLVWPTVTTTYTVTGTNVNQCQDTGVITVTVYPRAVNNLPDSVTIFPGESYQMDPQGNCLYFQWFPPLGLSAADISDPIAKPEANTRYFVNASTEWGCKLSDSIDVYVSYDSYLNVANAFRPGSGPNSDLKVLHRGDATLNSFSVYDRWGTKLFETSDINEGWDGTYKGQPQPMGVYVYVVEAHTPTGRRFYKQGNATLFR